MDTSWKWYVYIIEANNLSTDIWDTTLGKKEEVDRGEMGYQRYWVNWKPIHKTLIWNMQPRYMEGAG